MIINSVVLLSKVFGETIADPDATIFDVAKYQKLGILLAKDQRGQACVDGYLSPTPGRLSADEWP